MVILTGTVLINAINVPGNAQLTVCYNNVSAEQDVATMQIMDNAIEYANKDIEIYKWIDVVDGYTLEKANAGELPVFTVQETRKWNI